MMSQYKVIRIDDCYRCDGVGYVTHPAWQRYFEAFPKRTLPTVEDDLAWFREQGFNYYRAKDLPPEDIPCDLCKTAGTLRTESDLGEALRELGYLDEIKAQLATMDRVLRRNLQP